MAVRVPRSAVADRASAAVESPAAAGRIADPPAATLRGREIPMSWLVWLCLGIVYVVWGSTYLAIRVTDETMPPLLTSGARFVVAGTIVYTVVAAGLGRGALRGTREQVVWCAGNVALPATGGK